MNLKSIFMPLAAFFMNFNHAIAEPTEYETRHNPIQISGCSLDKKVIVSQLFLNVRFPEILDFETNIVPALISFGVGLDGKFEQYVEAQSAASIIDQELKHATFFKTVGTSLQNKMINRLQKELEQALNYTKGGITLTLLPQHIFYQPSQLGECVQNTL